VTILLAFRFSPWPGALVVRYVFNKGGHQTLVAMEQALPNYPVTVLRDRQYRANDADAKLDVYVPDSALKQHKSLPIVIWTHGGAWLSGDKADDGPYFERLANEGFVVVAVNYTLAPGKTYPTAVKQLNDAHQYVIDNAANFAGNSQKIILAGDSAGAQLSAQMAALATTPGYAKEVGVSPALKPGQLAGVILFCGIYKMEGLAHPDPTLPKIVGWGNDVALWSYTGSRTKNMPLLKQMSPYYHVTANFPSTFISGGNGDALTDAQSKPFAGKLQSLGVDVTTLFFTKAHQPSLPHEYQFTFNRDGNTAFDQTVQFLLAKSQ
jgi:acetyl esterase